DDGSREAYVTERKRHASMGAPSGNDIAGHGRDGDDRPKARRSADGRVNRPAIELHIGGDVGAPPNSNQPGGKADAPARQRVQRQSWAFSIGERPAVAEGYPVRHEERRGDKNAL